MSSQTMQIRSPPPQPDGPHRGALAYARHPDSHFRSASASSLPSITSPGLAPRRDVPASASYNSLASRRSARSPLSIASSVSDAADALQYPRPVFTEGPSRVRPVSSSSLSSGGLQELSTPELSSSDHSRGASIASLSLNDADQPTSTSMYDLTQKPGGTFGTKSASLLPRMKTIELYRQNAKKTSDPVIRFQFAQYMLQTALLSSSSSGGGIRQSVYGDLMNPPISSASSTTTASSSSSTSHTQQAASGYGPGLAPPAGDSSDEKLTRDLLKEAVAILRKLSDKGFADAQYLLGDALASGALGKPDLRESFSLFQLAAKHGHGEAAYRSALCLEQGWGTTKDVRRAVRFLRIAAARNQPGAMLRLGMACFYSRMGISNTPPLKQEGLKWLKLAANEANEIFPQAPYELAKVYEVGYSDIIIPDNNYAVQLYVRSAELDYVPAARVLGKAYELGMLGVPMDAALSIHYYTIGAVKGDPESMMAMCAWYMMGADPILPQNEEEAYEWALRAANAGLPKAQFAVGYFMEHGRGTVRDIYRSAYWYKQAADGGYKKAIARLSKEDRKQAEGHKDGKDKECIIC